MEFPTINWEGGIAHMSSYEKNKVFRFLNLVKSFEGAIDWNFRDYGKLWTYNLNYFDFLNQNQIDKNEALSLIVNYVEHDNILKDGIESYPISLRGINWIKFLSINKVQNSKINLKLYHHYLRLKGNLEYDLLGNHLLENGFSLLFGAYYFKDEKFYEIAHQILTEELEEQILNDGAHFELSPMYHQILLHRVLDCINLVKSNSWKQNKLDSFLINKGTKMLGWLEAITYRNGNIPMVNDCAYDIAPSSNQLFEYANYLKIPFGKVVLKESGYRKFLGKNYELFVDVGNIGPDYQPGHAHSDTFSFELYLNQQPLIVDVGTSTYEKNEKRQIERQTSSHNTVMIDGGDQSQVWDGFRVAKRAKITDLKERMDAISAAHDGYKSIGVRHERHFYVKKNIIINDKILGAGNRKIESQAFFHIHPSVNDLVVKNNRIVFGGIGTSLSFEGKINNIRLSEYEYCIGFNRTTIGQKICVTFSKELTTTIML
nr:alginate lyase family protein [uncultured Allomuricauda sp.]